MFRVRGVETLLPHCVRHFLYFTYSDHARASIERNKEDVDAVMNGTFRVRRQLDLDHHTFEDVRSARHHDILQAQAGEKDRSKEQNREMHLKLAD